MSQHLLLMSLGPVQDFIASARRCQDLWFGSWLLSDLARATAEAVRDAASGEMPLIFPAGLEREDKPAVANKILAVLPEGKRPVDVAAAGRKAMDERLAEHARLAFARVDQKHLDLQLANAQLADLMELIWVSVPFSGDADYAAARDQAERLLAARKNTRNWGPVGWHQSGRTGIPKSSLDGMRESVIHEAAYDELGGHPNALRTKYFVKPGERLCGIGLLKRVGAEPPGEGGDHGERRGRPVFHSTSHVASAPLLTRLARMGKEAEAAIERYQKTLAGLGVDLARFRIAAGRNHVAEVRDPRNPGCSPLTVPRVFAPYEGRGLDGYILFEGRLTELLTEYCKDAGEKVDQGKLKEAKSALADLRQALGLGQDHTAYYAFLLADGDSMGKAIDGLARRPDGMAQHRKLGEALESFSAGCMNVVESAGGSLVYAGGDDVLALCPLHTALQLARKLRDDFQQCIAPVFAGTDDIAMPTLSVGLGISHHMESMERARELAKQAERAAKDGGRNALAVVVSKRSGGTVEVARQWSDDAESLDRWLVDLAVWLERDELPDGLAFELERLSAPFDLTLGEAPDAGKVGEALLALAANTVARKKAAKGKTDLPESLARRLKDEFGRGQPRLAIERLSAEIQVARLFSAAYQEAFGPLGAARKEVAS